MFTSAVRTTVSACRGYECQEKDGIFMLAFADTSEAAASFGLKLPLRRLVASCAWNVNPATAGRAPQALAGVLGLAGCRGPTFFLLTLPLLLALPPIIRFDSVCN